jgi:hypothetical protein
VIDGQTGILVAQRDEKALHDAIVKLYDDADLREKLAQQGYDYLSTHFTRECMLDAMEKVSLKRLSAAGRDKAPGALLPFCPGCKVQPLRAQPLNNQRPGTALQPVGDSLLVAFTVERVAHPAVLTFSYPLCRAAAVAGEQRQTAGQRFHADIRERIVERRQDQRIRRAVNFPHIRNRAQETHA